MTSEQSASQLYRTDPDLVDDIIGQVTGDDVTTLARMIHNAVTESDKRAGHLSPVKAARALWPAFPAMTEADAGEAAQRAADRRGKSFE